MIDIPFLIDTQFFFGSSEMLLSELVRLVDAEGVVFPDASHRLPEERERSFSSAAPPPHAGENGITMVDSIDRLNDIGAAAAVITPVQSTVDAIQIIVTDPHAAFATVVARFRPPQDETAMMAGIDPGASVDESAVIHPTATIGRGVTIGARTRVLPGAVVMADTQVGSDCVLGPNVTIYPHCRLGDRVMIAASSVIGSRGFGFRRVNDRHVPTAQLGYVDIGDDVEIGSAVTVDRGTYGATTIGEGTKIDNQVMIAHNCQVGRRNLLCSQVGIAGSSNTGDDVILAGQVGLKDHVSLGDGVIVGAQAGVMEDLTGPEVYLGSPATTQREQMQIMAVERRLPEIRKQVKSHSRRLDAIESSLNSGSTDTVPRADTTRKAA